MKFTIEITETLQRLIEVEAENELEAKNIVRKQYDDELVVLDASDYIGTEINLFIE